MSSGSPAAWTGLAVRPKSWLSAGGSSTPRRALPPPPCSTVSSAGPMERGRCSAFHPLSYLPLDPHPYTVGGGSQEDGDPWSPPGVVSLCGHGNEHTHGDTRAPLTHAPGERLRYTACSGSSGGVRHPPSDGPPHASSRVPTVASETASRRDAHSSPTSPVPSQRSHLPRFPHFPSPHRTLPEPCLCSSTSMRDPGHGTAVTQPPSPSLGLPPPPPPPLRGLEATEESWGCCCPFGGESTPLSRYLGKVGEVAQPLINVGGLLNPKLSDVQT